MSASLVGSEMCIRDSLHSVPPQGPPRPMEPGELGSVHPASAVWQEAVAACLLYTSDAADDM
eukprot:6615014-Alexandrium_andersonii.AAC.1